MCSDKMRGLVTTLEDAVWMCGNESGKNKGFVGIRTLSKPIIDRAKLLREIHLLEERCDLWRSARSANGIEERE